VLLWDVATHLARAVLVQPIFELVPAGSSHLTRATIQLSGGRTTRLGAADSFVRLRNCGRTYVALRI
jgi:hypothetical protein